MKKEHLNTSKSSGFKVPKDYFEGLEDTILSQAKLEAQFKTTGFKVPESYFETVETSVLSRLDKPETKVISLFNRKTILSISSVAAAIVLLFNLNIFETSPTLENLDYQTVENYILEEIETSDLSLLIDDSELTQTDFIDYNTQEIDYFIDDIELNELYQE